MSGQTIEERVGGRVHGINFDDAAAIADDTTAENRNAGGSGRNTKLAPNRRGLRSLKARLMMADATALALGVLMAFAIQALLRPVPGFVMSDHLLLVVASLPSFALGAACNKLYLARANERQPEEFANVLKTVGLGMGGLLLISLALQYTSLSRLWVGLLAISIAAALLTERLIARSIFTKMREDGRLSRRIVIVGTDAHAISLTHAFARNTAHGYEVVGFAGSDEAAARGGIDVLGKTEDLVDILRENDAVGVLVSLASVSSEEVNVLTRRLTDHGYHVALSSSLRDIDVTRLRPQSVGGRTMFYVEPIARSGWQTTTKRVFDVGLAFAIFTVSLPVQAVAALAIKATSHGPVFFRQTRVGRNGELFQVLKFRSMFIDAEERKAELMDRNEADGGLFKIKNDPRITPVGRILRKLSIDELPQLFCVFHGTMSMVGPRPALPSEFDGWDDDVRERLRVPPGLTGMWQVSGRADSSSDDYFEKYKRMDLYYVDNWSLFHDVKICIRTIGVVLTAKGAS